ncbi:hypothetical protein ATKI12_2132 [Kitasatospora sp. Ki12]|uniref:hypothetical protein n=1 Tax=Kitasatospora xanthocidica TaxID=83382 RepID=UPI001673A689|nr:hypothetical protein [Kitasatospora xanthocidica]
MAINERPLDGFQVNRAQLVGGAVLGGIGAVLGATGAVLMCSALAVACRDWLRSRETPPTAMAHRALHEARVASTAGWQAWRSEHSSPN